MDNSSQIFIKFKSKGSYHQFFEQVWNPSVNQLFSKVFCITLGNINDIKTCIDIASTVKPTFLVILLENCHQIYISNINISNVWTWSEVQQIRADEFFSRCYVPLTYIKHCTVSPHTHTSTFLVKFLWN